MKKAIASGLVGLMALTGVASIAAPQAVAQDEPTDEERAERRAEREERRAEKLETLSSLLGVSADDLREAREQGLSLADVADAEGVDLQSVIDALVANAQARIDAKLGEGDIDADRAAKISEKLEERITARVNGERPDGPRGRGHHHGPRAGAPGTE